MSASEARTLTPQGFRLGAVAMLDALGFRGIWKRVPLKELIASLDSLVQTVLQDVDDLLPLIAVTKPVIDVRFLSDTVLFAVGHDIPFSVPSVGGANSSEILQVPVAPFSVEVAAALAALLQARAVMLPVPLCFRGAIGFGEYFVKENFLIGPTIDEVAAGHQRAKGAITWLLPSAKSALGAFSIDPKAAGVLSRALVPDVRVPLKGEWPRKRLAVNPIGLPGLAKDVSQRILGTFGNPTPLSTVWWKHRNTRRFLESSKHSLAGLGEIA